MDRARPKRRRSWGRFMVATGGLALVATACTGAPAAGPPTSPVATDEIASTTAVQGSRGLIAFSTFGWGQVIVASPLGGRLSELPIGPAVGPIDLSPDGRRLAVTVSAAGGARTVAVANSDGSGLVTVAADQGRALVVGGWSPDSRLLAVAIDSERRGANGVLVLDPASGHRQRVTRAPGHRYDYPVAWSPDGRWIAFIRRANDDLTWFVGDLYVVSAAGGAPVKLNPPDTTVWHYYIGPASFFPDSRRIAFVASFNNLDTRAILYSHGRVYVADVDGSHRRAVSRYHDWMTSTRVSPDGRWLVFDHAAPQQPDHALFMVRPDGTGEHRVAASPPRACCAVWSPDGTQLLAAIDGNAANNLVVLSRNGSAPLALTQTGGKQFAFYSWSQAS